MQPQNVFEFGARYFAEKKDQANEAPAPEPAVRDVLPSENASNLSTDLEDMEDAMLGAPLLTAHTIYVI